MYVCKRAWNNQSFIFLISGDLGKQMLSLYLNWFIAKPWYVAEISVSATVKHIWVLSIRHELSGTHRYHRPMYVRCLWAATLINITYPSQKKLCCSHTLRLLLSWQSTRASALLSSRARCEGTASSALQPKRHPPLEGCAAVLTLKHCMGPSPALPTGLGFSWPKACKDEN